MDYHFLFVSYQERIPSTKSVRDEFTMLFLDGNTISNFSFFFTFEIRKSTAHFSRCWQQSSLSHKRVEKKWVGVRVRAAE